MYYIRDGLKSPLLAGWFALACLPATLTGGDMVQSSSIAAALQATFGWDRLAVGAAVAVLTGLVMVGGIGRIARVSSGLVPAMALLYLGGGAAVLAARADQIPGAMALIFCSALRPEAAVGGGMGYTLAAALRYGVARGVFTNEAGLGTSAMAHAAAEVDCPARQGMWGIVEVCVSTLLVLAMFRDSEHISAAYGLALTVTMITTTILLAVYIWHDGKRVGAVVFTVVFLAIQFLFFFASMAKFLHGGWFTMLLTLAILLIMYTWNEGTKLERAQRRHMQPADCVPVLKQLHEDDSIPYFTDNIVYLTSDPEMKRVDTDIFFSIFADHPKRARAWWAVSVETSDNPFTREYSVENFGTDFLFRVRIRLGFKVSQSIPAYIHQIMNDLSKSGDLPKQTTRYPKLDADPNIGPIRYVLIHKALMPESKVSQKGAISLQIKYAIRHLAGSPVKWFGLAPYNPLIEIQPLFLATERPPRLKRV